MDCPLQPFRFTIGQKIRIHSICGFYQCTNTSFDFISIPSTRKALDNGLNQFRAVAFFFQRRNNLMLVLGAEGFEGNTKLHGCASVGGYKLVVLQLDNVAVLLCHNTRNLAELARLVGKQDGNGKDTVPENQTLLYHGGHGNDIHIASA